MKKFKQAVLGEPSQSGLKKPRLSEQRLTTPSWRFSTIDKTGPFRWPVGEEMEVEIIQKLRQFDSMSWLEIEGKAHHVLKIEKLSKGAKNRLVEIKKEDDGNLFSFHFSGRARIIGIRDLNVVKLLWWDPEHQVCPCLKKHS